MTKIFSLVILVLSMLIGIASAVPALPSPSASFSRAPLVGRADAVSHGGTTANTTTTKTTTAPAAAAKNKKSNFVSAPILESGTLFYVGLAATVVLWSSGKSVDYALQRQERYARYLATK
ncbi:hypothetical protein INT44_004476 [Umbelopsis vinacea]|uniref:Uncharacterized protein n=1 Tax=Umbelopsis vinacea TaxID=44442 RepID=A0A8H7QCD1_9FUNG|nr:hypothetical protein INT44_004476 [Umbelopsis vinacea]